MPFWSGIQDRLTGAFMDDDAIETSRQVAAAQAAILERQRREGVISQERYADLYDEVQDAGTFLAREDERLDNASLKPDISLPSFSIPLWVWILGLGAIALLVWGQSKAFKLSGSVAKGLLKKV